MTTSRSSDMDRAKILRWAICLALYLVFAFLLAAYVTADERVKYCKNGITGEIITVEVGMPCPYPTHDL